MNKTLGLVLLIIGVAIFGIGIMLGFTGVSSNGYSCGSALGSSTNPEDKISFSAPATTGCSDARADREPLAYGGLILGAAVGFSGLVAMGRRGES